MYFFHFHGNILEIIYIYVYVPNLCKVTFSLNNLSKNSLILLYIVHYYIHMCAFTIFSIPVYNIGQ